MNAPKNTGNHRGPGGIVACPGSSEVSRRHFLKIAARAGMAAVAARHLPLAGTAWADPVTTTSQVSLTAGIDQVDNVYRGLQRFKKQIAAAIGNRRVLIKPNNVIGTPNNNHGDVLLSDTPVESLEAILEFLQSIGKTDVLIAEACATDPTMVAFDNCGYFNLARKYPVRFMDLCTEGSELATVWAGASQNNVRISKVLLNPDYFVISAAKFKTHNYVVATLSLKNVVMAAPVIDLAKYRNVPGAANDKPIMHANNWNAAQDLHDNIYRLAPRLAPDLAVIDGFVGMEGNGPCWGTAVSHQVAVVSLDCMAADRVGIELMGVDPALPAYLNYCHQTGLGQYDLNKIEVLGESIANHRRTYRLHDNIGQYLNMRPNPRT